MKLFANPFADVSLNFSDTLFSSFWTMTCFVFFKVTFLNNFFSLSSKSALFTKLAISLLLGKFATFNLASKFFDVNLLNSWLVISQQTFSRRL